MDRLVSLAPSATASVIALDAADALVGATSHDDLEAVPALGGWLTPDLDRLAELDPDLVLTVDALQRDLHETIDAAGFEAFHHEPSTLADVLDGFEALGTAIGRPDEGRALANRARDRIDRIRDSTPDDPELRPVVYCEEWPDPPMAAGNWVPDAVAAAGGRYPFANPGERSREVDAETVIGAAPDHMVVHHCGFGEQASADTAEAWDLDAAVHVIDDSLLNQPSPTLIDGIELLADRLHGVPRADTLFTPG